MCEYYVAIKKEVTDMAVIDHRFDTHPIAMKALFPMLEVLRRIALAQQNAAIHLYEVGPEEFTESGS
jgi:hypothetical protein